MTLTPEQIEELRRLLDKASPGVFRVAERWRVGSDLGGPVADFWGSSPMMTPGQANANMHLFVESKKVLPALLASAEREERLEKALSDIGQRCAMAHARFFSEGNERLANAFGALNEVARTALKGNTVK